MRDAQIERRTTTQDPETVNKDITPIMPRFKDLSHKPATAPKKTESDLPPGIMEEEGY